MADIYIAQLLNLFRFHDFNTIKNILENIEVNNEIQGIFFELEWKSLKKIKKEDIPSGTTDISFQSRYNKPIEKGVIPNTVISIVFNDFFEQSLEEGTLPLSIKYLNFGKQYQIENAFIPKSVIDLVYHDIRKSSVTYRIHKLSINKIITLTTYYPNFHLIDNVSWDDYSNYDEQHYDPEDEIYEEYEYYEQNAKISIKIDNIIIVQLPILLFPNYHILDLFVDKLSIYIENHVENHLKMIAHPQIFERLLEIECN
jgi:hypothetical protein